MSCCEMFCIENASLRSFKIINKRGIILGDNGEYFVPFNEKEIYLIDKTAFKNITDAIKEASKSYSAEIININST